MDIRNSRGLKRVNARTRGLVAAMAVAGLLTLAGPALASLPQGHEVRAGQVVPEVVGNTMTIRQTSQAAKLDWKRFDIGKDHAVRIEQPNREAFLVNRVTGSTPSQINGSLTANGKVYLVNPNGIVFGPSASVNVQGLMGAAADLADEQMGESPEPLNFGPARSVIEVEGGISVRGGGVAALIGTGVHVSPTAQVSAPNGQLHIKSSRGVALGRASTLEPHQGAEVELPAALLAQWLDEGTQVTLESERELEVRDPISTKGADGSSLHLKAAETLGVFADIRLRRGGVRLESVGGSIHMSTGTVIRADSSQVAFAFGKELHLSRVYGVDLAIEGPIAAGFRASDKDIEVHTEVAATDESLDGLILGPDSNLKYSMRYDVPNWLHYGFGRHVEQAVSPRMSLTGFHGAKALMILPKVRAGGRTRAAILGPLSNDKLSKLLLPQLEKVVVGDVSINTNLDHLSLSVTQKQKYVVIDWSSFNLAKGLKVEFFQRDADWVAVNRVLGGEASRIDGKIEAKGKLFFFNPNGLLFSESAQVTVGGLLAAAYSLQDHDVRRDDGSWSVRSAASSGIANHGHIEIRAGGVGTLVGPGVISQNGRIDAPGGSVHLWSVRDVDLLARDGAPVVVPEAGGLGVVHLGHTKVVGGDASFRAYGKPLLDLHGIIDVGPRGTLRFATDSPRPFFSAVVTAGWLDGTNRSWTVGGDSELDDAPAIQSHLLSRWLDDGVDVRLSAVAGRIDVNEPVHSKGDKSGRLELSSDLGVEIAADVRSASGHLSFHAMNGPVRMADEVEVVAEAGRISFASKSSLRLARVGAKELAIDVPVQLDFAAKDKVFDGTADAQVDHERWSGLQLQGDHMSLRPIYRFAGIESGKHPVSAEVTLVGFNGHEALPLSVVHDQTPEGVARRTASILPLVKPTVPEIPPIRPEVKPTVPEIKPDPAEVKPSPLPPPARFKQPLSVRRAVACEARRDVPRGIDCDASAPAEPSAAAPVLMDRGIRAPR